MKRSATPLPRGRPDEAGAGLDAQEGDLLLQGVAHVLRAVVVPQGQAAGDVFGWWVIMVSNPVGDGLQGLEARTGPGGVDTHYVPYEVVDGYEHHGHSFLPGPHLGGVGAPDAVGGLGNDGAVVALGPRPPTAPARWGACSPRSRIRRLTRSFKVGIPLKRRRPNTLR